MLEFWGRCRRFLNAVERGTDMPIHRHADKNESFVVLQGKVRSTTYNDDGTVIESVVLCQENGGEGVEVWEGCGGSGEVSLRLAFVAAGRLRRRKDLS